jgi:hypothetical protein
VAVDGARTLIVVETATNSYGTTSAVSAPVAVSASVNSVYTAASANGALCNYGSAITSVCGDGGLAVNALFEDEPGSAVAVSPNGASVYVVDNQWSSGTGKAWETIRKISTTTGAISTVAGSLGGECSAQVSPAATESDACGDGGVATSASLN